MLRHNSAGGKLFAAASSWAAFARERDSSALHIYSQGFVTLDDCDITDDLGLAMFDVPADSAASFFSSVSSVSSPAAAALIHSL
jgi:hypothetical protein